MPPTPHPTGTIAPEVGYDISYPQCVDAESQLPSKAKRVIAGLSGRLANEFNPCFANQVKWGRKVTTTKDGVAIYVNTANPGPVAEGTKVADWPQTGGACHGGNTRACAYEYGKERAKADLKYLGDSGADFHKGTIFLDVESDRSWADPRDNADAFANNRAALEGMTDTFQGEGFDVGIYSTATQWHQIVGDVPLDSHLHDLPVWVAGAETLENAEYICRKQASFTAGKVVMAQVADNRALDRDVVC